MQELSGLEKWIFDDWESWDPINNHTDIQFYNAKLKINTKIFDKNEIIPMVSCLYSLSKIELYGSDGNLMEEIKLKLSIDK